MHTQKNRCCSLASFPNLGLKLTPQPQRREGIPTLGGGQAREGEACFIVLIIQIIIFE